MIHVLKTDPQAFEAVFTGAKTYEIRYDDRGFSVGDELRLLETKSSCHDMVTNGKPLEYTGRYLLVKVTHILRNHADGEEHGYGYGVAAGYAILSVRKL